MPSDLTNSLRLSAPISEQPDRQVLTGDERFVAMVEGLDGKTNISTKLHSIALYLSRMINSDPAFVIPVSSINGLGDILNVLANQAKELEARVTQNEGDIEQNAGNINILLQGPMLRTDTWT